MASTMARSMLFSQIYQNSPPWTWTCFLIRRCLIWPFSVCPRSLRSVERFPNSLLWAFTSGMVGNRLLPIVVGASCTLCDSPLEHHAVLSFAFLFLSIFTHCSPSPTPAVAVSPYPPQPMSFQSSAPNELLFSSPKFAHCEQMRIQGWRCCDKKLTAAAPDSMSMNVGSCGQIREGCTCD